MSRDEIYGKYGKQHHTSATQRPGHGMSALRVESKIYLVRSNVKQELYVSSLLQEKKDDTFLHMECLFLVEVCTNNAGRSVEMETK